MARPIVAKHSKLSRYLNFKKFNQGGILPSSRGKLPRRGVLPHGIQYRLLSM